MADTHKSKLTDVKVRSLKPTGKLTKHAAGKGLSLWVMPTGSKLWRFRYRNAQGKEQVVALGVYPDVTLKAAEAEAEAIRVGLRNKVDPMEARKEAKLSKRFASAGGMTFRAVTEQWMALNMKGTKPWSPATVESMQGNFALDVFPIIGDMPIADIKWAHVKPALAAIQDRGAVYKAHRTLNRISTVFKYAMADDLIDSNPADGRATTLIAKPDVKHTATVTDMRRIGELLRMFNGYTGTHVVRCALRVMFYLVARPQELRMAEWSEFDFKAMVWNVPAAKMKLRIDHRVPLTPQAVALLREVQPYTGKGRYVFPAMTSNARPMSENTINSALRRMGIEPSELSGHGVRGAFSTVLNTHDLTWSAAIERQLSHVEKDKVKAAYDHSDHWDLRTEIMQVWAGKLDEAFGIDNVVSIRGRA